MRPCKPPERNEQSLGLWSNLPQADTCTDRSSRPNGMIEWQGRSAGLPEVGHCKRLWGASSSHRGQYRRVENAVGSSGESHLNQVGFESPFGSLRQQQSHDLNQLRTCVRVLEPHAGIVRNGSVLLQCPKETARPELGARLEDSKWPEELVKTGSTDLRKRTSSEIVPNIVGYRRIVLRVCSG